MDLLFTTLLAHIRKLEWKEAVDLVVANPILITLSDDELHLSPLHHALFNKANFYVISTFVSHWLLKEDLHSLTEMQLVHLACEQHATFDVIRYLSALSPEAWKTKNSNGYTPFMIALSKQLDEDILYILDDSDMGAIGDFCSLGLANRDVVDVYFEDNYKLLDSEKMLFRLEHKDPTLKCLVLSDEFHSLYPKEDVDVPNPNHSKHKKAVMDVLDAIKSFPYLDQIVLTVDRRDSIIWREGETRNALFSVLRDLPSKVVIEIRLAIPSFDPVAEMIKHCPNVKFLSIRVAVWAPYGNGTVALMRSLSDLPVLESLKFSNWNLSQREALLLHVRLMKKKSLKSICMVGTRMTEYVASRMLQIYKDSDECDQLEFISFFGNTSPREQWQEQWQEDLDMQLAETAHFKNTRRSVSDFMNKINSRDPSSNGSNEELQFMNDILDADDKDSQDGKYDSIGRPDHLYALIKSKPDYLQRCVHLEREYSVSNKRQKIV
jgi:hypothetical protein